MRLCGYLQAPTKKRGSFQAVNCPGHGFVINIPAICIFAGSNVFFVFEFQGYRTNHFAHVCPNTEMVFAIATEK